MPKKSQVTIFMIIGVVILIAAGLFIYLSKSQAGDKQQDANTKTQKSNLKMQPIKDFVSGCLDKLSKDAIVLIGKQGGYIYKSQGGTFVDFEDTDENLFYMNHDKMKAAYNIKPLLLHLPQAYSSDIPAYPWNTFPYGSSGTGQQTFTGIFGINGMPSLERQNGPHSMQEQIESYIDKNMDSCLDFSPFAEQGYNIIKSQSRTQVIFGTEDISVRSSIPVKITDRQTVDSAQLSDFSANVGVRIKEMYYFISRLVQNDITDITFNINDPANSISPYIIRVEKGPADDIIKIRDTSSSVYGQEYEYIFGRKNRAPALHYISGPAPQFGQGHSITRQDLLRGSDLKAEDPDEDNVEFTIKAQLTNPNLPTILNHPSIDFKVEASDGELTDYQIITVKRT